MSFFNTEPEFIRISAPRSISAGRVEELYEYRGKKVKIIRSSRRTRTIEASLRDGVIQIAAPARMPKDEIFQSAKSLISKIERKRALRTNNSDEQLYQRALHLARTWLGGQVVPREVVWSTRQNTRWGSCTPSTGRIRISATLRTMPQWVIDGVLVHELAHLKYLNHGDDFKAFAGRYPRMDEAMAFLNGYTHANQVAGRFAPGALDTDQDHADDHDNDQDEDVHYG